MPSPAPKAPSAIRGGRTIRVGIALLAVVAFALSYDALRQMAVAGHVRGLLTYLFPLVIDGFIAIGIVALIILRTAPVSSRFYVWMLVGVATGTSIGANVVHAVGLNEGTRLRLNNATAGALSAIAPLALAGAVHLYLVMNRHLASGAMAEASPATPPAASATPGDDRPIRQEQTDDDATAPSTKANSAPEANTTITKSPPAKANRKKGERKTTAPDTVLWSTARAIGAEQGTVPRTTLEAAIRAQGYTIQKDRAKEIANAVTAELASAANTDAAA
ncbi:DUF2637 domain-containing protein [Streptomyces sp. DG2A-72]|uniref:DUF2637 domain-containing protein n=1 Tax=Streptomyces sp. DG2A-72 TaxID=3051386 RepID=UPI00265BE74C|nr:DUF2637 domain-containing protein [Streptomyces sp. DG2A-72]MDO0935167.1 DUF2637 domain-containing protein [Streptomyces sp. DG2A-72]